MTDMSLSGDEAEAEKANTKDSDVPVTKKKVTITVKRANMGSVVIKAGTAAKPKKVGGTLTD